MLNEKILIRSSIWLGFGSIAHNFLIFILIIILARFGRASELGIFYTLLRIFFNVTSSANTLINTMYMKHLRKFAAKKKIEKFREMMSSSITTSIVYSFFAMIIFLIMAKFLFLTSSGRGNWFLYTAPLILAIPFQILSSRIGSSLLLLEKFKEVVFLQKILSAVLRLGLVIIFLIVFQFGLYGTIISQSIAIIALGFSALFLVKKVIPDFKFKKFELINIKKPSNIGLSIAFSGTILKSIDLITVALLLGFRSLGHSISVLFLSLAFSLKAISFIANDVLFAFKYYMEGSLINVISAVVFVSTVVFTYKNGTFGIAQAFLFSSLIEFLLREFYQYKKTGIFPINRDVIKVILGGGIAGFASYFIPNSIFSYILFLMLFLFFLIITKTLRKKGLFYHV